MFDKGQTTHTIDKKQIDIHLFLKNHKLEGKDLLTVKLWRCDGFDLS